MRVALAILLEIVAVIPRSGHAQAVQLDDLLRHAALALRRFDGDAPGRTIGLAPLGLELARDFHQVAAHPQLPQAFANTIDGVPGGNTVEVHLHTIAILAQLAVAHL
ncbi:hypothetical protein D3C77_674460 [compost metagenome]